MRKIFKILLLMALISGCEAENTDYSSEEVLETLTSDYPDEFIEWKDLFNQKEESYFIYVFSYDCFYCKQTKMQILEFYEKSNYQLYFVEYTKEVPIGHNITNTLGKKEIKDVFIKGTPSLILINDGVIKINVAGKSEVCQMIDLYLKN
ncbi:MAG: thioredoxin family protein [Bacilli bacterium]|nr:thioredoxin family protein [Bacilli bacterium]